MRFLIALLALSAFTSTQRPAASPVTTVQANPKWTNALKPSGETGPQLALAEGGKTSYLIVVPAKPTTQDEKAAADLAFWLREMTGAEFPIVKENRDLETGSRAISIGRTGLLKKSGRSVPDAELGEEGAAIASDGNTLYLHGGKRRGPIYAVYVFLEEDLGCRWYTPGTATIPSMPTLKVSPVTRVTLPAFERREPYYLETFEPDWSLRNRTAAVHCPVPEEWGGYPKFAGHFVHTFNLFMPPDEFFAEHPEYFAEIDGARNPSQLCMTHGDVRRIFAERVIERLNNMPGCRYVDVSPNDWRGYCDCRDCAALRDAEGGYIGPLLDFVNDVAQRVSRKHPGVTITTLAYLGTVMPPKTIRPHRNVQITLCSDSHAWDNYFLKVTDTVQFQSALEGWSQLKANVCVWDYQYIYRQFMQPNPNLRVTALNLKHFAEYGVRGLFLQGGPHGIDRGPMRAWIMAKLAWNPELDLDALVKDFYFGYFGEAAEPLYQYDVMLDEAWQEAYREWKAAHPDPMTPDAAEYSRHFHPRLRDVDDAFTRKSRALFDEALAQAGEDRELVKRIEYASLSILFLEADRGRTGDVHEYMKIVNQLERIALANDVRYTRGFEGQGDLYNQLAMWRALAFLDPATTFFTDLSNEWWFSPDPEVKGIEEGWARPEFDDSGWGKVRSDLGHRGWESQGFSAYTVGYGWYRQKFFVPADFDERHNPRLFFGAVDEQAEVWLNGEKALSHTTEATGMSKDFLWKRPFHFDPVKHLKPGEMNTIAVRVHNSLHVGGIYKPVRLVWGETSEDLYVLEEFFSRETAKREREGQQ